MLLRFHATLLPPDVDAELLTASAGPDDDAIALWFTPNGPTRWAVTRQDQEIFQRTNINTLPEGSDPRVQPLPDGAILVANVWCTWREGGPDRNATVYDRTGAPVTQAVLGDGIRDILTTTTGDIWVGYTDQGIHGNNGWAGPAPTAVGRQGLIRYNRNLQLAWQYKSDDPDQQIDDCEALNVTDDVVYAYIYTDYSIAEIRNDTITNWQTNLWGARSLLIKDVRAALIGFGYKNVSSISTGPLKTGIFTENEHEPLQFPDDLPVDGLYAITTRGPELHIFREAQWYRSSIDTTFVSASINP